MIGPAAAARVDDHQMVNHQQDGQKNADVVHEKYASGSFGLNIYDCFVNCSERLNGWGNRLCLHYFFSFIILALSQTASFSFGSIVWERGRLAISFIPNRKRSRLKRRTRNSYRPITIKNETVMMNRNLSQSGMAHCTTKKPRVTITVWCKM